MEIRDSIMRNDIFSINSLHFHVRKNELANTFIKINGLEKQNQEMTITHSDLC